MFKEEYQKQMNQIKPNEDFLKDLAKKMEAEGLQQEQTKIDPISRKRNATAWVTVAAAAVICIGIGFVWQGKTTGTPDENYMTQNAGAVAEQEQSGQDGVFTGSSWYGDETNAEKIYEILMNKMQISKRLVIMKSDSNTFETAHEVSAPEEEEMVQKLMGAVFADDMSLVDLEEETVVYYMVEFDDGTIVKFAIYNDMYFYCSEFEGIFTL